MPRPKVDEASDRAQGPAGHRVKSRRNAGEEAMGSKPSARASGSIPASAVKSQLHFSGIQWILPRRGADRSGSVGSETEN